MCIEHVIRKLCNGAADHVHDSQDMGAEGLALPQCGYGVGRFPRLGDDDKQRALIRHRLPVTQLAGNIHLHRQPAQRLDNVFPHKSRVVGGAAAGDHDFIEPRKFLRRHVKIVRNDPSVPYPWLDGGFHRPGLLHYLLEHEVVVSALFGSLDIPYDMGNLLCHGRARTVVYRDFFRRYLGKFAVLHIDHVLGVGNHGGHIRGKVVLPHTDAQNQGAAFLYGKQPARLVGAEDAQRIGPLQTRHRLHHRHFQVTPVIHAQKVRDDFRICFAEENITLCLQLLPEHGIVLNDAVMYHGKPAVRAQMRVGVGVRRSAMCGPARMGYAANAVNICAVMGFCTKVFDHAGGLDHLNASVRLSRYSRRVVTAVFKLFQVFQQYGSGFTRSGKAYNSAHSHYLLSCFSAASTKPRKSG